MASLVAIGDSAGSVATGHGCTGITSTDQCSSRVFIGGIGVVRSGDMDASHTYPVGNSCPSHRVALSVFSNRVFSEGKGVGRQDDSYGGEKITSAGQSKVIAG